MDSQEKINLIKRNSVEIINEKSISSTIKKKDLKVYCGYEISGEIHLGHLVTIFKLMDFQKAGITPIILLADWHTWLNKKGDWKSIEKETKNWEKGIKATGLKAKFMKGTDFQKKPEYIDDLMELAINTTVNRGVRSMQMVARDIESAKISQLIYPLMQIADIKHLDLDFVTSGLEQRKIHALGTELFDKIKFKKSPIFIHTGLITSLKGPGNKMSSSIPESMISIRDSKEDIEKKIKKAHCIEGETEQNPILEITKYIIFPKFGGIEIKRPEKFGGNLAFSDYKKLESEFKNKNIHPLDLKNAVAEHLEKIIEPIRKVYP